MDADALVALVLLLGLVIYFAPTILSFYSKHPHRGGIFILNLFLGWTGVGWVGALVWAAVQKEEEGSADE